MADNDPCAAVTADPLKDRRGRLIFRAWRRGFREADLILGPFVAQAVGGMNAARLDELETLLDQDDHALYAWSTGAQAAPADLDGPLMRDLRAFVAREVAGGVARGIG